MRLPEERSTSKVEKSYAIEADFGEEEEGDEHSFGKEDAPDITTSASVMTITGKATVSRNQVVSN